MNEVPQVRWNPETGQMETVVYEPLTEEQMQADLDNAQNELNQVGELVAAKEQEWADAEAKAEALSKEVDQAKVEHEKAQRELTFQEAKKASWDQAVALREQQSEPAQPTDDADAPAEGSSNVVEQPVPVHLATDTEE